MFTRTRFSIVIVIMAAILAVGTALGQQATQNNNVAPPRPNRQMRQMMRRRGMRGVARGLHQLNLTDQQQQQMRTIVQSQVQGTQTQRQELRQLAQKRRTGTLTDAEQARAKELRQQLRQSRQGVRTQMLAVLTPEQKAKLDEMIKTRRANRAKAGPGRRII